MTSVLRAAHPWIALHLLEQGRSSLLVKSLIPEPVIIIVFLIVVIVLVILIVVIIVVVFISSAPQFLPHIVLKVVLNVLVVLWSGGFASQAQMIAKVVILRPKKPSSERKKKYNVTQKKHKPWRA